MAAQKKKRIVSMFRRFFILMTAAVLICLTLTSFTMMFFFVNIWKDDMFTSLSDDALGFAQSVDVLLSESDLSSFSEEDLYSVFTDDCFSYVLGSLSSISQRSGNELFLVCNDGEIALCVDMIHVTADEINTVPYCNIHSNVCFEASILKSADILNIPYTCEADLSWRSDNCYLAVMPVKLHSGICCYVVALTEADAAYLPFTTGFLRMLIFSSILAILISLISSAIVSYRMVRPLKKVTEATNSYAAGDFSMRINTSDVYKELSEMVSSVNSMADSLSVTEESRSSFVANVSHELKTPMTIISGFVDGILDGTISPSDEKKYLQIVSDETKRLSRLVVAMLNMSRIEAGKLNLLKVPTNLKNIILNTLIGFEIVISGNNISVNNLDMLEDVIANVDDALINQVIYNLIDNAVKFTPQGGSIHISLTSDKKTATLLIRNSGKGISSEECGLVFDRFYKVDKSRGLDAKSFGMGLYIVKSIIDLHGGNISINSEPDKYTEFVIKLPL